MAINASERADILELLVLMFDAAPGAGILADVVTLYETAAGRDLASLATILGNTGVFQLLHPVFESAEEFAAETLAPLGLAHDSPATDWVIGQYNAGASKAAIMHAAWAFFNGLPPTAPAQYLNAKAIVENKAQVAEYYSVVLARSSGSIAVLQDVVADVTADPASVDAAIAQLIEGAATGPVLTRTVDLLNIFGNAPTTITGLVDGNADGSTTDATFSAGDRITGNGNTRLDLTVLEGGDAGFVRLQNIDFVDIAAATTGAVSFNAAEWIGVDAVRLDDGVNGLAVTLANARAGMDIAIVEVAGTISADYVTASGRLSAVLRNNDAASSGRIAVETTGAIDIDMADGMTAEIANTTGIALGDISVSGGDLNVFSASFDAPVGIAIGDLEAVAGNESTLSVAFGSLGGPATAGGILLEAGNESSAVLRMQHVAGHAAVGDVELIVGNDSNAAASFGDFGGNVTLGDVDLSAGLSSSLAAEFNGGEAAGAIAMDGVRIVAGASADIAFHVEGFAAATVGAMDIDAAASASVDVVLGDLSGGLLAGDASIRTGGDSLLSLEVTGVAGGVTMGDVSLEAAGARASVALALHANSGDVALGSVATLADASSDVTLIVQDAANLSIGSITQAAGAGSTAAAALAVASAGGNLAVGDVSLTLGAASEGVLAIANSNAHVGTFTAGDIAANAGGDSSVNVTLLHVATLPPEEDATAPSVGNATVGDITLSVGSATSISAAADAYAAVLHGGKAAGIEAGDLTVGDVSLAVGDGFRSGTQENAAEASFTGLGFATAALGDIDIGNVSLAGGDFASLSAVAGGVLAGPGTLGEGSIGDIAFTAGESAFVNFDGYWAGMGAEAIGSIEIGAIEVNAAQDAVVSIDVLHGAISATVASVGDLDAGGLEAVLGDNAQVAVGIEQSANEAGDFRVGDIAISVSATATADLSGGSLIGVDLSKRGTGVPSDGGDFEVGDVTLSAGAGANIDLDIAYSGAFENIGDVDIGTIGLAAGDGATAVYASVLVRSDGAGDFGAFALAGVDIGLGEDAAAAVDIRLGHGGLAGDFGDVSLGAVALALGEDSEAAVLLDMTMTAEASVDDFSIGPVTLLLEAGAQADLAALDVAAGSIGDISLGAADADIGAGASFTFDVDVSGTDGVGAVTIGHWDLALGVDASAHQSASFVSEGGAVGALNQGGIRAAVSEGADAQLSLQVIAGAAAGGMTVGAIELTLDDGGAVALDVGVVAGQGNANLAVGDITLQLEGTDDDDAIVVNLTADGSVSVGKLTVSGEGHFSFIGADVLDPNTSGVVIGAGAAKTIGDVDFSAFTGDAMLDLSWATAGAASIVAGSGDDSIRGNAGANVITGGAGLDTIDIGQGGNDTIVTNAGDSGKVAGTFDTVTGFSAGDRLDFNLVAGASGNYVERSANFTTVEQFLANAKDALNSSVRYFVQDNGTDTYIAVNYGSGEADVVIVLAGVADATTLQFQDFIA